MSVLNPLAAHEGRIKIDCITDQPDDIEDQGLFKMEQRSLWLGQNTENDWTL